MIAKLSINPSEDFNGRFLLASVLTALLMLSHGHLSLYPLIAMPLLPFLPFLRLHKRVSPHFLFYGLALGMFLLFQYEGDLFVPLQIYTSREAIILGRNAFYIGSFLFFTLFCFGLNHKSFGNYPILILMFGFLGMAHILSLLASPRPIIDVWNIHQAATDAILNFLNPYEVFIKSPYKQELQNYINPNGIRATYLPGIYIFMAPFKLLLGDTRWASVFSIWGGSLLLLKNSIKTQGQREAFALAYLFSFLPINFFILEQAWNDPLIIFMILLLHFFVKKGHMVGSSLVLGWLLISKQYAIPPALIVLWSQKDITLRKKTQISIGAGFLACLIIGLFISFNPAAFWESIMSVLLPARGDSLSLSSWLFLQTGKISARWILAIPFLVLIFSSRVMIKDCLKRVPIFSTAIIYLILFFFFSRYAYCNYYWFCLGLLFLSLSSEVSKPQSHGEICWPDLFFLLSRTIILLIFIEPYISDVIVYYETSNKMLAEGFWKTIKGFEYPPLAAFLVLLPRLVLNAASDTVISYKVCFAFFAFVADFFIYAVLRKKSRQGLGLVIYSIQVISLYNLIYDRLDVFVALILLAIVTTFSCSRVQSFISILVGGALKIVPLLLAPILLCHALTKGGLGRPVVRKVLIIFSAMLVCLLTVFYQNIVYLLNYHLSRGIQIESVWDLPILLKYYLIRSDPKLTVNFGSWNFIETGALIRWVGSFSFLIPLGVSYRRILKSTKGMATGNLILFVVQILLCFITFFKVLSPQYFIWLFPFIPLLIQGGPYGLFEVSFLLVWLGILFFTQIIWADYQTILALGQVSWMPIVVRNILLLILFGLCTWRFFRSTAQPKSY
jgi:hypothetical protein